MKRINWRPFLIMIALFGAFQSIALGADVSGNWFGVFHVTAPDGSKRDDKAVVILQQQGDEVTGSLGKEYRTAERGRQSGVPMHWRIQHFAPEAGTLVVIVVSH